MMKDSHKTIGGVVAALAVLLGLLSQIPWSSKGELAAVESRAKEDIKEMNGEIANLHTLLNESNRWYRELEGDLGPRVVGIERDIGYIKESMIRIENKIDK